MDMDTKMKKKHTTKSGILEKRDEEELDNMAGFLGLKSKRSQRRKSDVFNEIGL